MNAALIAVIRTIVPMGVGAIASWLLVTFGLHVTDDQQAQLVVLGTFLLQAFYYMVVKWLEARWPRLGVLLGIPKAPVYGYAGSDAGDVADPNPNLNSGVPPAPATETAD